MKECEKHASFGFYDFFILWYTLYALHTNMPYAYPSIPLFISAGILVTPRRELNHASEAAMYVEILISNIITHKLFKC
jgi:hypothetical protein